MTLIERELIKKVESMTPEQFYRFIMEVCGAYLQQDAAPVVYGRWKYFHKQNRAVCMNCSFERDLDLNLGRAISCPNCGCKMDGGEGHGL